MLHSQFLFSLAIAAIAEAIVRISAEQVPSLQRVALRYLKLVTSSNSWPFMFIICTDIVSAVGHDLARFCADFHSIYRCSVYERVDEFLKFIIAAARKIDVVSKS